MIVRDSIFEKNTLNDIKTSSTDVLIDKCTFTGSSESAVKISDASLIINGSNFHHIITNNTHGSAINCECYEIKVSNCNFT